MKCPVIVKFIRSDNKTLIVDGTDWILPNDGLDGFGEVSNDLSAVDKSVGDGSVLVSKRVNSIDREIKAVVTDKRLNQTLRYKATSFFNGKFSFKIFVTYMGRTRWCDGEIRKFFCPSENIYDKVYFSVTFFCANPFMKSEEDFGKNIAGVTPMVAFPYLCGLKTGEYKTTKSGKEITISGENTRIDAIQVHGQSEQNSYSGKNLFSANQLLPEPVSAGGIIAEVVENGGIRFKGTQKVEIFSIKAYDLMLKKGNYVLSGGNDVKKGALYIKYNGNYFDSATSPNFTIKEESVSVKIFAQIRNAIGTVIDSTVYLQLEKGLQATPYEPYVGGKPSPNPDYPQEIVSKPTKIESNGANGEKSVANIITPLCGIKVASGGNYTDENGQQWITDELVKYEDGSGKYIKRIDKYILKSVGGKTNWSTQNYWNVDLRNKIKPFLNDSEKAPLICNNFQINTLLNQKFNKTIFGVCQFDKDIYVAYNNITTKEEMNILLESLNTELYYALQTPQETPLSSEQMTEIEKLKTYSPHCVISNDGNIPMNLQYVTIVGGKKHIEGRPTGRFDFARKVELHNDGDVEAYCKAIFVAKGEVTNPKLIINGKYVRVITTMHSDDVLVIDFTKDPPTVRLNGKNIIGQTDRTSNFDGMQLNIGDSEIGYDADTGTGLLDVSIYYNKLYGTM